MMMMVVVLCCSSIVVLVSSSSVYFFFIIIVNNNNNDYYLLQRAFAFGRSKQRRTCTCCARVENSSRLTEETQDIMASSTEKLDFSTLLPPSWETTVVTWLQMDIPKFDIGGFVVGESNQTANILGKSEGVIVVSLL